jgi:nucleoside phosphorylase
MKLLILSASLLEIQPWLNQYQHCVKFAKPWKYYEVMLSDGHHVTCAVTGLGAHAAASSALGLMQHLQPDGVVVCGTAGGLQAQQEVGDLLLIEACLQAELWALQQSCDPGIASYLHDPHDEAEVRCWEPLHAHAMAWLKSCQANDAWKHLPKVHFGSLITSQCFPFPSILEALMHQHDCMGIDMETFAVMNLGRRLNIPVLPLRVISNV